MGVDGKMAAWVLQGVHHLAVDAEVGVGGRYPREEGVDLGVLGYGHRVLLHGEGGRVIVDVAECDVDLGRAEETSAVLGSQCEVIFGLALAVQGPHGHDDA